MKLPKTVKIGGMIYKVLYPYKFVKESDEYVGLHSAFEGTIKVSAIGEYGERNNHKILSTFIHECLHGIDFWMHPNECTEEMILKLERAVIQLLVDNVDLTKEIPEKVRIGSNWYKIIQVNKFDNINCIRYSFTDPEACTIELAKYVDGDVIAEEAKRIFLMKCILNLILVEYVFTMEEVEIVELERISFGIYTWLKDNKIYELVRRELMGDEKCNKLCNNNKRKEI